MHNVTLAIGERQSHFVEAHTLQQFMSATGAPTGPAMGRVTGHAISHVTTAASTSVSDCSDWFLCSMSGVTTSTNGKALYSYSFPPALSKWSIV